MGRPKITIIDADTIPNCPHCGGDLSGATVTVDDLLLHYPFGGWLSIGVDAYAREGEHLTTSCPSCTKPVVMGFEQRKEPWNWRAKFAAARTKTDTKHLNQSGATELGGN